MKKLLAVLWVGFAFGLLSCAEPADPLDYEPRITALFNAPGSRAGNEKNINAEEFLVERIRAARSNIKVCIYGFSNKEVYRAVIDAHLRGVNVRVVGDARHFQYGASGYEELAKAHVPMQLGNQWHIMHNKFFVIDDRFVFVGTGNITTTGFNRNDNNWVYVDSPLFANDFVDEFEQMFEGRFSAAKTRIENGNTYQIGDTKVEVLFSPQEDAMGRILEELDKAEHDIHFTIFAFTKDQIGSRFIRKHREFQERNREEGLDSLPPINMNAGEEDPQPFRVAGVLDRSQIHGNFLYHEVYRLAAEGIPMHIDANENARLTGDYQAGGGRLHSKTMLIDVFGENPRVITGSFNWSSAATIANDEVMLILHGKEITMQYYREFLKFWGRSKEAAQSVCNYMKDYVLTGEPLCSHEVEPGDVIISEVHYDGWNGVTDPTDHTGTRDELDNDEFVELYNTTDKIINLSLWTVTNGYDFKIGFTPGTVIYPGQYFVALDHNLVPHADGEVQYGTQAFKNGDYVVNIPNDPRMPRLNISNSNLHLELRSASAEIIDQAGDYGPPFGGGREIFRDARPINRSMERIIVNGDGGDGTEAANWQTCQLTEGGANVNDDFKAIIVASPGEANSTP